MEVGPSLNIFSMTLYHWGAHKQGTYDRKGNGGLEGFFKYYRNLLNSDPVRAAKISMEQVKKLVKP